MKKRAEIGKTYIGVVEENVDPDKHGRLKVRVLDFFEKMEVEDIPWASPWKDLNGNQFSVPDKGKVVIVVFDQGDINKPEFIFSEHYNVNLENKIKSLSNEDYLSMKSLLYDHRTQIYVNESEGLKIDHKYNNINITENSINLNLKDNKRIINIGDKTANQQAVLGNNWMTWFDEFVDHLMGQFGGALLSPTPCMPSPPFLAVLLKYKALRDTKFLSHHVNIVDNDKTSTVKGETEKRQDESQQGDKWVSTKEENKVTTKTEEDFKPVEGPKPKYDENFKAEPTETKTDPKEEVKTETPKPSEVNPATGIETKKPDDPTKPEEKPIKKEEPLSSPTSNTKIDSLIKFMESKDYRVFKDQYLLNIVGIRNKTKKITNVFDDQLNVFYIDDKGNWTLKEYDITTVPGLVPGEEKLPENVAMLALGQYLNVIKMSNFQEDTKHPCLKFDYCAVHRNNKRNKYDFTSPIEQGSIPMYIHRSSDTSTAQYVFNYSEGSQVFKNINHYDEFMELCKKQLSEGKKELFTYTLTDKVDYEKSTESTEEETKLNKYEKYAKGKIKQAKDKYKDIKDKVDKKIDNIQQNISETKEIIEEKLGSKQVIAALIIEGYFKDENEPNQRELFDQKVDSGMIAKRTTLTAGGIGKPEFEGDTYYGLKQEYKDKYESNILSSLPEGTDSSQVFLLIRQKKTLNKSKEKAAKESETKGTTEVDPLGFVGTVVVFTPPKQPTDKKKDKEKKDKEEEKQNTSGQNTDQSGGSSNSQTGTTP
jgi:ElaB/YqjD/DUF883 family membrane-anchored ribosome-binding protein